ncbi:hypothetical protein GIB67_031911 [Kingdonia uniflora]|uniref:SURF1-like protein n=1 Tax=Kingdonia uniflora TaxID=39325 RepID=A0A7J7NTS8_9MAGN|nr:hypothetical protein GIB67_031911 [Kingdonia uniflora]
MSSSSSRISDLISKTLKLGTILPHRNPNPTSSFVPSLTHSDRGLTTLAGASPLTSSAQAQGGEKRKRWSRWLLFLPGAITFGLGTWQIFRRQDKVKMLEYRKNRLEQKPLKYNITSSLDGDLDSLEFRRVTCEGVFDERKSIYVGPRSRSISGVTENGYCVITPLMPLPGSNESVQSPVLVNRGWVPRSWRDKSFEASLDSDQHSNLNSPAAGEKEESSWWKFWSKKHKTTEEDQGPTITPVEVIGVARGSEKPSIFVPANDPSSGQWFYVDVPEMARAFGLPETTVYIEDVHGDVDPGKPYPLPKDAYSLIRSSVMPQDHLNYMLTWSCKKRAWKGCLDCQRSFLDVKMTSVSCTLCSEKPPSGLPPKFSAANYMDPRNVLMELSRLTNLERILIARIHPMMSVYRVKGQQYKYSGNAINFAQDVNAIAASLPCKPSDLLAILIVNTVGTHVINFVQDVKAIATSLPCKPSDLSAILIVNRVRTHGSKEFRVRREYVRQALAWFKQNHIYYSGIHINDSCLQDLPEDGVPDNLPHVQDTRSCDPNANFESENVQIDEFETAGTVANAIQPNQHACISNVIRVAENNETTAHIPFTTNVIDEFSTPGYITMVFPTLFPYGTADLRQARPRKVNLSEYFQYLMKYKDGRFAKDPRFRYFSWNSISRWRALALGDVYIHKNPEDGELSIQDIKEMLASGNRQFLNRISYYAKSTRETRAYWFTRVQELTSMVQQLGAPTIFFTLSAADMQWPELMELLDPTNKIQNMNVADQKKAKAQLLNENHLFRYEWQNRGSGLVHGFLWLEDAPELNDATTNSSNNARIIDYFDHLVCTMNHNLNDPLTSDGHPCARKILPEVNMNIDDDDYSKLINWIMRHSKCESYCLRLHKTTKQLLCRFRYPFDVLPRSEIIEEPPNSNMFRFVGCRNDPLVCSHNRMVLQAWRANIDWSLVLSVQAVVNYIGKYAVKLESASIFFTDTLREIVEDLRRPCQTVRSAIKRLLMKTVSERDISAQEVCHLLMSYYLQCSSRKIVVLTLTQKSLLSTTIRRRQSNDYEDTSGTQGRPWLL